MSQRSVLYQCTEQIRKNMPHLPNPQTKALAAFSMGIAKSESCRAAAKRVVGSQLEYKPVVFLVYETGLKDRLKAMAAAVAFAGRAIPVAWRRCPNEKWQMGLVELIAKTLGWARDAPGRDRKAIAVADRGIGNSPKLLGDVEGFEMFYLWKMEKSRRSTSCPTRLGCLGVAGLGRG